jgi:hypothetical protein
MRTGDALAVSALDLIGRNMTWEPLFSRGNGRKPAWSLTFFAVRFQSENDGGRFRMPRGITARKLTTVVAVIIAVVGVSTFAYPRMWAAFFTVLKDYEPIAIWVEALALGALRYASWVYRVAGLHCLKGLDEVTGNCADHWRLSSGRDQEMRFCGCIDPLRPPR